MTFIGIAAPAELRLVIRAHVLAWRKDLERRKLAALSSLFEYLCDQNSVPTNPIKGVKRPKVESYEGKTPALGDSQARHLLKLPAGDDLKALRDCALLSLLLHHGLRREELSSLKVHDVHLRRGVPHLRVRGKGGKLRHIPLHPGTQGLLADYLEGLRPRARQDGRPLLSHSQQPHRGTRAELVRRRHLQARARVRAEARRHDRRARAARHRGDQRARARGRHREGA